MKGLPVKVLRVFRLLAIAMLAVLSFSQTTAIAADNKIYALRGALWTTQQINVCWENATNQDTAERGWVRDTVRDTWAANSSLTLVGWTACQPGTSGLRIRIEDAGPHTNGLGTQLDGMSDGMILNFTFNNFSQTFCQANVPGRREHCIRVVAMHEFGHALGFAHEQNRADAPDWCQAEAQGTNGDVMVTDFDMNSVMNYCNNASWPQTVQLSAFDVIGLQRVYGVPGGPLPASDQIFAVNLTALHPDCNRVDKSRDPACVAAEHRVCAGAGRGGAGLSQEVGPDVFGVACFTPSSYGDVALSDLANFHGDCNDLSKSQDPACMAAVHRWCSQAGIGGAGVVQEVGNNVFGVACFQARSYEDVSLSELRNQHPGCDSVDKSQSGECVAAIHRWCIRNNKGTAGLAQEVGNGVFGVACFDASWYGDVALH